VATRILVTGGRIFGSGKFMVVTFVINMEGDK
jgi:hypothetical protein